MISAGSYCNSGDGGGGSVSDGDDGGVFSWY